MGLIRCLLYRAFRLNSTWSGFHQDVQALHICLQKNNYPQYLLERVTRSFVGRALNPRKTSESPERSPDNSEHFYFKLPYIGKASNMLTTILKKVTQKYCRDIQIKLVFMPFKIGSCFLTKIRSVYFLDQMLYISLSVLAVMPSISAKRLDALKQELTNT